jgi:hypothetical protein
MASLWFPLSPRCTTMCSLAFPRVYSPHRCCCCFLTATPQDSGRLTRRQHSRRSHRCHHYCSVGTVQMRWVTQRNELYYWERVCNTEPTAVVKRTFMQTMAWKKYVQEQFWRMVSSGMLHRVALVRTGASQNCIASIIRVTSIGELGRTLAVTCNRSTLRRKPTRRSIPEDDILHSSRHENLKSYYYYIQVFICAVNERDKNVLSCA